MTEIDGDGDGGMSCSCCFDELDMVVVLVAYIQCWVSLLALVNLDGYLVVVVMCLTSN
jgi:hypothetical protein